MMYFHKNKSIKRKFFSTSIFIFIFGIGLLLFFGNRNIFANFKTYYIQSYSYIIGYKIKGLIALSKPELVSGLDSPQTGYAKSIPILLYHGVLGGSISNSDGEATNIDLATFWDQMKVLKENGWQTITIEDLYDFKIGKKDLPEKSFMITFDDGRKDSYYPSNPILSALGFHAVMFVIDQYSLEENSNYYLSKAELQEMSKSSQWELQSHGYSSHSEYPIDIEGIKGNFFSNRLWIPEENRSENINEFTERVKNDLFLAKDRLEKAFSKPIIAFAFPFGDYGQQTINFEGAEDIVVPEVLNIYPLAFYQYSSIYRYSQTYVEQNDSDGKFMIKRISISPHWKGEDLLRIFEGGSAKELPFFAKLDETDGWVNTTWGLMAISNNTIVIESEQDSTGSTIVLDGTNTWTDYKIKASVRWIKGSNVYLQARYKDDNNLVACNFKKDLVHIEQVLDGKNRVIAGMENEFDPNDRLFTIEMKVSGRNVECSIDGKVIVSTPFLEESLGSGGIGIKIWDSIQSNSKIIIDSLVIENI